MLVRALLLTASLGLSACAGGAARSGPQNTTAVGNSRPTTPPAEPSPSAPGPTPPPAAPGKSSSAAGSSGRAASLSAPHAVLLSLAFVAYEHGNYELCEELFAEAARSDYSTTAFELHNAASCATRLGEHARALDYLEDSRARENAWIVAALEGDPDLAPLQSHSRWASLLDATRNNRQRVLASNNHELVELFEEESLEREAGGKQYRDRSRQRKDRVGVMLKQGLVRTPVDYYHAAIILGTRPQSAMDLFRANVAAKNMVLLAPNSRRYRAVAARIADDVEIVRGKPQKYGTVRQRREGQFWMPPVDQSVTDEERAAAGVPPLAVARRAMNITNAALASPPQRPPSEIPGPRTGDAEPRARPKIVPTAVLETNRIFGVAQIPPPMIVRMQMVKDGKSEARTAVKICVDRNGWMDEKKLLLSTGYPEYDQLILDMMRTWRFKPLLINGHPTAVCTSVTFIYRQS